ncbi:MAG TPA: hypothetical protein VKD65_09480 [Candidatus Angelobacter sp.]|nr:hypothetical protein [Candidatus Angelobacter sp.]
MGSRKIYFILVAIGAIAAIAGIFMMRSSNSSFLMPGRVLGWGGIAVLLIARIFFARRRQPPPAPKAKP